MQRCDISCVNEKGTIAFIISSTTTEKIIQTF